MRIRCDKIYTCDGCMDGILEVINGRIEKLLPPADTYDMDMRGCRILPGLIDIHTHGYHTWSSQSTKTEDYQHLSMAMASQGITSFLVTAGEHNAYELQGLSAVASAMEEGVKGARILGIHMEGPFLNSANKGAFMKEQLLPISQETMMNYLCASHHQIRYMSISPELDPDGDFIHFLKEQNILVAGGHTTCDHAMYKKAVKQGLDASTHTGNAMKQITAREVNALGAALLQDDLYCEMICDLIHISPQMLSIYIRVKGYDRLMMISDSGQLSGLKPGRYRIHDQNRILCDDGKIVLEDGSIAGSSKSMLWGVQCLESKLHIPMENILRMTSCNQARFLNIDDHKGCIEEGMDADFVIIDPAYRVIRTYVEGVCVYDGNRAVPMDMNMLKMCRL